MADAAYSRRDFAGGAVATTITGSINASDTSIEIDATTGWPSGTNGEFFVVINEGNSTEEKVRIDTRSTTTLTVTASGRGVDGTTAAAHSAGESIRVCLTAFDLDEANKAVNETVGQVTAAGQLLIGDGANSLAALDAKTSGRIIVGNGTTAASVAVSGDATLASSGALTIANNAITNAKLGDDAVDSAEIADGAIDTAHIADLQVTTGKIAADAITNAKIADDQIDSEHIVDGSIDTAHLGDLQVTTGKLAASAVTGAKLNAALNDLSDTTITAGAKGDVVTHNGTAFVDLEGGYGRAGYHTRTANQSINNAEWTDLTLTAEAADNDLELSISGSGMLLGTDGLYLVIVTVTFAANSTGSRGAGIEVSNGTLLSTTPRVTQGASGASVETDVQNVGLVVAAGGATVVQPEGYQSSGGALNVTETNVSVARLGSSW